MVLQKEKSFNLQGLLVMAVMPVTFVLYQKSSSGWIRPLFFFILFIDWIYWR